MAGFDPDAYLASSAQEFNPDTYLASPSAPNVGMDIAKQIGSGLVTGTEAIPAAIPSLLGLAGKGLNALAPGLFDQEKTKQQEQLRQTIEANRNGGMAQYFPSPETKTGEFARTTFEFLPSAAGMSGVFSAAPRNLARNLAAGTTAGLSSEAAGQATKGTEAEPYARIGSALLGGSAALRGAESMAARKAAEAVPSNETILQNATNSYKDLRSGNIAKPIPQSALDDLVSQIKADVAKNGPDVELAPVAHQMIDKISQSEGRQAPITERNTILSGPGYHIADDVVKQQADIADLVTKRQNLKSLFKNPLPDENKAVAALAIPKIDAAIERFSPGTMEELRAADANYSSGKTSQALDKKVNRAELRAAGEHSGMNLGNKLRQKAADMLLSNKESRGLTDANRAALEAVVRGTVGQNLLRAGSNLLGGGGGLGATLLAGGAAGFGGNYVGHPEAALLPFGGVALRALYNRSVAGRVANVDAMIRARSPASQTAGVSGPAPQLTRQQAALLAARYSLPATRGILPIEDQQR